MIRTTRMPVLAFTIGLCLSLTAGSFFWHGEVLAQSSDKQAEAARLAKEITDLQSRSREIDAEIATLNRELQTVGSEKTTLQRAINVLELERKKISAGISLTQNKIGSTDLEISKLTLEIGDMRHDINVNTEAVKEMMRRLNESDDETILVTLLREKNLADFWNSVNEIQQVREAISARVKELSWLKSMLESKSEDEELKRDGLIKLKNEYNDQQNILVNNKKEKDQLLTQTKSKEVTYQALLAEKQVAKEKFERELRSLESKLKFILDPNTIPTSGSRVFNWPVANVRITQYFGDTEFARSGAYSGNGHNGIDIGIPRNTPVMSALAGKVIAVNTQVAPMCQYGKWVLVRHANGLTTLYAHLSLVSVNNGDEVGTGDVVGYSGDTGYATGPHLHFTVYASPAVNFRQYTCNSGITLTIPVSAPSGYLNPMSYLPPL